MSFLMTCRKSHSIATSVAIGKRGRRRVKKLQEKPGAELGVHFRTLEVGRLTPQVPGRLVDGNLSSQ